MAAVSILIVDDHQPFRQIVRMALQSRTDFHVVAEAADGMEAVQAARTLQPDVILLDVNLPQLNGIEASKQIHKFAPHSKVLLVTQESSPSFVSQVFHFGVAGYVHKAHAYGELIPAIDSVLRRIRFIGSGLGDNTYSRNIADVSHHRVQFYSDDAILLESFGRHVAAGLRAGDTGFVVATKSHLDALAHRLRSEGLDLDTAMQQGTYVTLDAATALSNFMIGDLPDPALFSERSKGLAELAESARSRGHRVVACGETTHILWSEGKIEAAIRAERLWNEVVKTFGLDALCAYSLDGFQDQDELLFERVCVEHSGFLSR
jgi:DNA-binding NarL/FixJ family response regulator